MGGPIGMSLTAAVWVGGWVRAHIAPVRMHLELREDREVREVEVSRLLALSIKPGPCADCATILSLPLPIHLLPVHPLKSLSSLFHLRLAVPRRFPSPPFRPFDSASGLILTLTLTPQVQP